MSILNFVAIMDLICGLLEVLKHVFSLCSLQNIGHSDLVSGGEVKLAQMHLTAKLKDSSCNRLDLSPFKKMKNQVFTLQ